jgi:hypothetical protein
MLHVAATRLNPPLYKGMRKPQKGVVEAPQTLAPLLLYLSSRQVRIECTSVRALAKGSRRHIQQYTIN